MAFDFKPVDLGPEGKRLRRIERWKHVRKTLIYMLGGIVISLVLSFFMEGSKINAMNSEEITSAVFTGAFIGLFITNSPCTRGKC